MKPVSRELATPPSLPSVSSQQERIEPLFPRDRAPTVDAWERDLRPVLVERWRAVVGEPSFGRYDRAAEIVGEFDTQYCHGTVLRQPTGPDQSQQVVLLEPTAETVSPRPCAVVPYYHPDLMAGFDLATRQRISERPNVQFGRQLAERGFVVACTEAFPFNTVPEPAGGTGFAWWQAATDRLLGENPRWTGIGKLTSDTSRAVDLLLEQQDIDAERVLAIGHSLGGKMAFYAAAFDPRITACIASDFGIAWGFTNWDAPWYFGEQVHAADFTLNGHHALALIAPRSFLMIAGEADRPESWGYIREAQRVYELYAREDAAGCFLHMTGHQPTEEAVRIAWRWLGEQFGLPLA